MNFIKWLLSRIKRTLLGEGQWQWIYEYRRLIIRSKVESILVTIFGGLVWFIVMFGLGALFLPSREALQTHMELTLLSIPAFYIYNWLGALYEIYDAERMATWDQLKTPHR
jgi:hypothetical protein